jgi:hypothetical protein
MWSPDGKRIGIVSSGGYGVIDIPSQSYIPITAIPATGFWAWCPDSRHVVFVRDGDLYLADVENGGEATLLANPAEGNVYQFGSVSDDGRWIYATIERNEVDIWMMEKE